MIHTATQEQWDEIERIRKRWIYEYQTEEHDIAEVVKFAREFLAFSNIDSDIPVFAVHSPIVASAISVMLREARDEEKFSLGSSLGSSLDSSLRSSLRSSLDSSLRSSLDSSLRSSLGSSLDSSLRSSLRSSLDSSLRSSLDSSLRSSLDSSLGFSLGSSLGSSLDSSLRSSLGFSLDSSLRSSLDSSLRSYCTAWWGAWSGWYEGGRVLGVEYDDEKYRMFQQHNRIVQSWIWCDRAIYVLTKPREVHWGDDDTLSNESGPSYLSRDGLFSMWHIGGVQVDEQIVLSPETQTTEQIQKEDNAEVKRIRIERFGWQRYLEETNAAVRDKRNNEIEQTKEALFVCDDIQVLVGACPSTGRVYSLEVPTEIETCEAAQSWLSSGRSKRVILAT